MSEVLDSVSHQLEQEKPTGLNSQIAVVVSVCACLMAVFNIKDNNIVQAMSLAQAHMVDSWSFYQAKSVKQNMAENERSRLELQLRMTSSTSAETRREISQIVSAQESKIQKYEAEKAEIEKQAEGYQEEYDKLNVHDDQFDLAEALISLSLSMLGITALLQRRSLFYFSLVFAGSGLFFGLAGLMGWSVHPDVLMQFLS